MVEIRTVTMLRRKCDEVRGAVRKYELCLDQARADLAHLTAAIAVFEAKGGDESLPAYSDLHRLFRYGEAFKVCQQALVAGRKTTRELAVYVADNVALDVDALPTTLNFRGPTTVPASSGKTSYL